jgi:hypothetical protein
MSRSYVSMSFRSLPKVIRDASESSMPKESFREMITRPRYGLGVRKAAMHFYEKKAA